MINYWSAQCQYLDWISSAVSSGRSSFVMHIVATLFALPRPLQGMCFDVCRPWHSEVLVLRSLSSVDCRVMEGKVCWSEWTKIERNDRSRYIIRNIYVLANYFNRTNQDSWALFETWNEDIHHQTLFVPQDRVTKMFIFEICVLRKHAFCLIAEPSEGTPGPNFGSYCTMQDVHVMILFGVNEITTSHEWNDTLDTIIYVEVGELLPPAYAK